MSKQKQEALVFALDIVEIPVEIGGRKYVLREADGHTAAKYRDTITKSVKMTRGQVSGIGGIAEAEPLLVSMCLFAEDDEGGYTRKISLDTVKRWPSRIVKSLFTKAQEISGLKEEDDSLEGLKERRRELDEQIQELEDADVESTSGNSPDDSTDG